MLKKISFINFFFAVSIGLCASGCVSRAGYKKPVTDFANASSVVVQSANTYVMEVNKAQRDAYIDRRISDGKQLSLIDIESSQMLSPEAIEVRVKALRELSKYGDLLLQLVDSDAPQRITANASDLQSSIKSLGESAGHLNSGKDKKFKESVGVFASVAGEIASLIVEKKIENALDAAVKNGQEPVADLVRVIRDDLIVSFQLKRSALSENRVIYVDGYEKQRLSGENLVELRARGEELKASLDAWSTFPESNPVEALDAMVTAHAALVDYAKSPKKAKDLADFSAQMQVFVDRANRVGMAVLKLRELSN